MSSLPGFFVVSRRLSVCLFAAALLPVADGRNSLPQRKGASPFPTDSEIQRTLNDLVAERRAYGIVVETRDANGRVKLFHAGSSGKKGLALTGDAVFEIGSITKTFTATLLAEMVCTGEVQLDDPVSDYLPASVSVQGRKGKQIRLVDLATHVSSLPFVPNNLSKEHLRDGQTVKVLKVWRDYSVQMFYEFLASYRLPWDIGTHFEYSNVGVGLLGHALALREDLSWEAVVRERILDPLHLKDTRTTRTPDMVRRSVQGHDAAGRAVPIWQVPALPGFGSLNSTANDLMRYAMAYLEPSTTAIRGALSLAQEPRRKAYGHTRIGLVWDIGVSGNKSIVWHGGATLGCNSFIGFDPATGAAVVILANTNSGGFNDLGLHLLDQHVPFDEEPPAEMELYRELMKRGFKAAIAVAQELRHKDARYHLSENGLNNLGYRLLNQERLGEALAIFKLNVRLYPGSFNTYDSLAEAYETAGKKRQAIRNYRRSLQLNRNNRGAAQHLKGFGCSADVITNG